MITIEESFGIIQKLLVAGFEHVPGSRAFSGLQSPPPLTNHFPPPCPT